MKVIGHRFGLATYKGVVKSERMLFSAMQRLSTGKKLNRPGDAPADYGVSQTFRYQIRNMCVFHGPHSLVTFIKLRKPFQNTQETRLEHLSYYQCLERSSRKEIRYDAQLLKTMNNYFLFSCQRQIGKCFKNNYR